MAKSIIDLFNEAEKDPLQNKNIAIKVPADKTPYYSDDAKGELDEKSIKSLEASLGKKYGKGTPEWGSIYNDGTGKRYSDQVKKD